VATVTTDVIDEWTKDCRINPARLREEALGVPFLHAKYLRMLRDAKAVHRQAMIAEAAQVKEIRAWYRGLRNTKEALEKLGRPAQRESVIQSQLDSALDSDPGVQEWRGRTAECKDLVDMIQAILLEIGRRNYHISSAIKLMQMEAGQSSSC
jgi:hypothetical protein